MPITDSLYQLFGAPPDCTDDELRRAYYRALREQHPDKNPDQMEAATAKTQQLTSAYAELRNRRAGQSSKPQVSDSEHDIKINAGGYEFTISFSFGSGIDIEEIANRKTSFRNEWENFQQNPTDPISALKLVHAAFRAERQDSLQNLLINPILIDSAPLLLSIVEKDAACDTLIRWSGVLQKSERPQEAIQMLEDTLATGMDLPSIADELRRLHYSWAQYTDPTTGNKPTPDVRIKHLYRILELGFKFDYIYKLIAEAYHDWGNDEQARVYLRQAYELNPELSGAVRISRALGLAQSPQLSQRKTAPPNKYKFSRPEQIPSVAQVHKWTREGNWDTLIEFANPQDYSPRILSKARETLRLIANALDTCKDPRAIETLIALLNFDYYWDVSEAAMTSLSKIGDERTLGLLQKFRAGNSRVNAHLEGCISYLRARISNQHTPSTKDSSRELMDQAEKSFANGKFGETRILLENLLANLQQSDFLYLDASVLLARSCAEMNDLRTSLVLIKPLLPKLSKKTRDGVLQDVSSWLWSDLVFQQYSSLNDENYRLALEIHSELALLAKTPDAVLKNLRDITRWLELLGANELAQQIRQLIRDEAPGTWYVDRHDREQYIRKIELSPYMTKYLLDLDKWVKTQATTKLKQILNGIDSSCRETRGCGLSNR